MQNEEWRPITGYEGLYEVSSLGKVRSLDHVVKNRYSFALRHGRILKQSPDRAGYLQVHLSKKNDVSTEKVHRIVAATFLGLPPTPDAQVNHLDFTKSNNVVNNLEWCSRQVNHRHAVDGGRLDGAISSKRAKKLTSEIVLQIRAANANGEGGSRILARRFNLSAATVQKILNRNIWARI